MSQLQTVEVSHICNFVSLTHDVHRLVDVCCLELWLCKSCCGLGLALLWEIFCTLEGYFSVLICLLTNAPCVQATGFVTADQSIMTFVHMGYTGDHRACEAARENTRLLHSWRQRVYPSL